MFKQGKQGWVNVTSTDLSKGDLQLGGDARGGEGGKGLDDYVIVYTKEDTADANVEELGTVVEKLAVGEAGGSISNCSERVP